MCTDAFLAMEMQAIEENNKRMQHIFDTQEFKPTDVERIKRGRQELQRQIDAVGKEIEEIDRQVWDAEMTLGKTQERVSPRRFWTDCILQYSFASH